MTNAAYTKLDFNGSAVLFGVIIGIGFWIGLAALGIAIGMSTEVLRFEKDLPTGPGVIGAAIITVFILALTFFIAGFVASRAARQQNIFDSLIHSLGSWALMAILLVLFLFSATAFHEVKSVLSGISAPVIITDLKVLEAKATTTIKSTSEKKTLTPKDHKINKIFTLAWWIVFSALLIGLGGSLAGGFFGNRLKL